MRSLAQTLSDAVTRGLIVVLRRDPENELAVHLEAWVATPPNSPTPARSMHRVFSADEFNVDSGALIIEVIDNMMASLPK